MPPGVTLTATLKDVIAPTGGGTAVAVGSKLQITLCGFGASIPLVPGDGLLAYGAIPQEVVQVDTTPISINLYNNAVISPAGTFYCIALLDDEDDIIQANNYQFLADGTFDLSNLTPIIPGTPTMYAESPTRITPYQFQLSHNVIGGAPIGVYFNGGYQRMGPPPLDYQLNGRIIVTTFPVIPPDTLYAVYMGLGNGGLILSVHLVTDTLTPMGAATWTLSRKPLNGTLIGLYYNDIFQRQDFEYEVLGQTVTPNFATYAGDSVYAVYYSS
jgi:hypothetical protein